MSIQEITRKIRRTRTRNNGEFASICREFDPKPIVLSGGAERAKCTLGYDFSEEEYITAASSIGGVLRDGAMAVGSWSQTPPGCLITIRERAIHFSQFSSGINDGKYSSVCKGVAEKVTLLPAVHDMVCEPEQNFSKDECISAASTIGGNLRS